MSFDIPLPATLPDCPCVAACSPPDAPARTRTILAMDDEEAILRPNVLAPGNAGYDMDLSITGEHPPILPARTLREQPTTPALHPEPLTPRRNRVLIADDDALVRGSLAAVLEGEGFAVDEAKDGVEAVARATAQAPDLVLLDLNMPKMDGWTAFTKLDRVRPLVPVIVITARPHQYQAAVRLGVDAFMEKPLDIPVLVRAVKRLTNEDEGGHTRRITDRGFVTRLLDRADS